MLAGWPAQINSQRF